MKNQSKTAIVTGGSRGIGKEIAKQLVAEGFSVIIAAKDKARGEAAAAETGAAFLQLDVSDEKSIHAFAAKVKATSAHIDVLVNNAGVLKSEDQSMLEATSSLIDETFRTNAIGALLLTNAIVPLMNSGGRVIMMSSGGGSMTDPVGGWSPVYCVSKALLNAITRQLASELRSKKISVNSMCPGWVRTDMGGRNAPRTVQQGADTAVWLATATGLPTGKFFRDRKEIPF